MYIPKSVLKKLNLRKESELIKEAADVEEARAIENTKRFKESLEVVNKVGKEIGEMRDWSPYCSDPKLYMPFPIDILKLTQQQMLQLLIHAYGTADHLSRELKSLQNMVKDHQEHGEPKKAKNQKSFKGYNCGDGDIPL